MHLTQPIVIEATGTAAGLQLASDLVAIDGTLGVLGYYLCCALRSGLRHASGARSDAR
jgi:hypothetical protein